MLNSCDNIVKKTKSKVSETTIYPSDVISFMDEFKIFLGAGTSTNELVNYKKTDFLTSQMMVNRMCLIC